jgi:hypothetical protein
MRKLCWEGMVGVAGFSAAQVRAVYLQGHSWKVDGKLFSAAVYPAAQDLKLIGCYWTCKWGVIAR